MILNRDTTSARLERTLDDAGSVKNAFFQTNPQVQAPDERSQGNIADVLEEAFASRRAITKGRTITQFTWTTTRWSFIGAEGAKKQAVAAVNDSPGGAWLRTQHEMNSSLSCGLNEQVTLHFWGEQVKTGLTPLLTFAISFCLVGERSWMSCRVDPSTRACDAKRCVFSDEMISAAVDAVCCIDAPLLTARKDIYTP